MLRCFDILVQKVMETYSNKNRITSIPLAMLGALLNCVILLEDPLRFRPGRLQKDL